MKDLTSNMEMYLKTIYEIVDDGDSPRVKTIAKRLRVTMPSVSGAVENLQKKGLVDHTPYGDVSLTTKGKRAARTVKNRNDLIFKFLNEVLKIPTEIASRDACVLEHVVSPKTLDRLSSFLEYTQVCQKGAVDVIDHFSDWLECSEHGDDCTHCGEEGETRCTA